MALTVLLPHDLETMVQENVDAGLYQNASELVRVALSDFFAKPDEGKILAYFIDKRRKEIEDTGEAFEEADLSQLKRIRQEINRKTGFLTHGKSL